MGNDSATSVPERSRVTPLGGHRRLGKGLARSRTQSYMCRDGRSSRQPPPRGHHRPPRACLSETTSKRSSWVGWTCRHAPIRRELEIDCEQLAVGVRRGLAERDPLAADAFLDDLTCVCHGSLLVGNDKVGRLPSGRHSRSTTAGRELAATSYELLDMFSLVFGIPLSFIALATGLTLGSAAGGVCCATAGPRRSSC